jgi:hypothetical protein
VFFNSVIHATDCTHDRMQRPERRTEPCATHVEPSQHAPEYGRGSRVDDYIDEMIGERI